MSSRIYFHKELSRTYSKPDHSNTGKFNLTRRVTMFNALGFKTVFQEMVTMNDKIAYQLKRKLEKKGLEGDVFNKYLYDFELHAIGHLPREEFEKTAIQVEKLCREKNISKQELEQFNSMLHIAVQDSYYDFFVGPYGIA